MDIGSQKKEYVEEDVISERIDHLLEERIPWLFLGLLGGLFATFVVSKFEGILAADVRLAFFIPIIVYLSSAVGTPEQPLRRFHRFQHIYLWFLYGLVFFRWQFDMKAFRKSIRPPSDESRFGARDRIIFWVGKLIFLNLIFVIPMLYHPWWAVLACYIFGIFSIGLVATIIFSLAHCVNEAEHPLPDTDTSRIKSEWMVHQLQTTANLAPQNPVLSFNLGGQNHQIEHHLFYKICHIHYPKMAKIIKETCDTFNIPYKVNPSFWSAIKSHYLFLKKMGNPEMTDV